MQDSVKTVTRKSRRGDRCARNEETRSDALQVSSLGRRRKFPGTLALLAAAYFVRTVSRKARASSVPAWPSQNSALSLTGRG
jgi:hypothetical protein